MEERTLIIIPAFNEAGRIGAVVHGVRSAVPHADVLVVDDGSKDGTRAEASGAGARVPRPAGEHGLRRRAARPDTSTACRQGYRVVGQIDGDGQHRPQDLPDLLAALDTEETDVVVGSRFLDGDGHYNAPRAHAAPASRSSAASPRASRASASPTRPPGYQVMRVAVAEFFCSEVYPSDYPDADILICCTAPASGCARCR